MLHDRGGRSSSVHERRIPRGAPRGGGFRIEPFFLDKPPMKSSAKRIELPDESDPNGSSGPVGSSAKRSLFRVPPCWDFQTYSHGDWSPGAGMIRRVAWAIVSGCIFESGWLPVYRCKRWLLRCFGARVGQRVVIKPNVRIKFPWRLVIEDDVWIGQGVWIDNLEQVSIGSQCCLSQAVYLCTGSHDFRRENFMLRCRPIRLEHHVWCCARSTVLPGTVVPAGTVITAGSVIDSRSVNSMATRRVEEG